MNNTPFPIWNTDNCSLVDGILFDVPQICVHADKKKCSSHYNAIKNKKGFFICPKGLSSYSTGVAGKAIYSGIRVAGNYDIKKLKNASDFLPTLPVNTVIASVEKMMLLDEEQEKQHDINLMNSSLHEIRKFNVEIKSISEELIRFDSQYNNEISKKAKTIFAASSLISVRLNIYYFDENPGIVTSSTPYSASIYGKFEKIAHILEIYAKRKSVSIQPFKGNTYKQIDIYPVFEFLPFVILENAVKYSPDNQDIIIEFEDVGTSLNVIINSIGPVLSRAVQC